VVLGPLERSEEFLDRVKFTFDPTTGRMTMLTISLSVRLSAEAASFAGAGESESVEARLVIDVLLQKREAGTAKTIAPTSSVTVGNSCPAAQ
jgi:hypothetical protein